MGKKKRQICQFSGGISGEQKHSLGVQGVCAVHRRFQCQNVSRANSCWMTLTLSVSNDFQDCFTYFNDVSNCFFRERLMLIFSVTTKRFCGSCQTRNKLVNLRMLNSSRSQGCVDNSVIQCSNPRSKRSRFWPFWNISFWKANNRSMQCYRCQCRRQRTQWADTPQFSFRGPLGQWVPLRKKNQLSIWQKCSC